MISQVNAPGAMADIGWLSVAAVWATDYVGSTVTVIDMAIVYDP